MKKQIVLLGLLIFAILGLGAQTINLEKVRLLALANSRELAQANLSVKSSVLDEKASLYPMLPVISAGYSASSSYLNNDWAFVSPKDTFKAGIDLKLTQMIFDGGRNYVLKTISSLSTESARKNALAVYFSVLDSADSAYYAVLEAAASLEAEESSLKSVLASLEIAEIRQASGMINPGDYLKALADRETRENSRNQARRTLSMKTMDLKSITGLSEAPQPEQIDFSGYETLLLYLGAISDNEAASLYSRFRDILAAGNPQLAREAYNVQSSEKNLSLAKRKYFPEVKASIISPGLAYSTANGFSFKSGGGGIAITGTIPIDFWNASNSIEKSRINAEKASLNYTSTENQLESNLQSTLYTLFSNAGTVLSSRRSLEYADKHYEYVMERYKLSQSSISDLVDASTLLITNRNNLIKAQYGFLRSLSTLRSMGAIDDEAKLVKILMGTAQ